MPDNRKRKKNNDILAGLEAEITTLRFECDTLRGQCDALRLERDALRRDVKRLIGDASHWKTCFDNINNAAFWKISQPVRFILDKLKKTHRLIPANRDLSKYLVPDNRESLRYEDLPKTLHPSGAIAVHIHLFYPDLLDEFCFYLNNIPFKFDIYVSVLEKADKNEIKRKLKNVKNTNRVIVKETPNIGRDLGPFFTLFSKKLIKYDYLLHFHSKKSLYSGFEQSDWRQNMLERLLGSEELVYKIITLFEQYNTGLYFPETTNMPMFAESWCGCAGKGRELCRKLGITFEEGIFNYPMGSFFWAKKEAIQPLFDLNLTYTDYPKEPIPNDGTILHALERILPFVVKPQNIVIYEKTKELFQFNLSNSLFRNYGACTMEGFSIFYEKYNCISFDIFDTLITRLVLEPDDVFYFIEALVKKHISIEVPFISLRKEAEAAARQEFGWKTNIHHIYSKLAEICRLSIEEAEKIKEIEIQAEMDLCIPRRDMLDIFNHLKSQKKNIVLISDMYLTSEIITLMLNKSGYFGWDELVVSCENGLRKDTGEMWNWFIKTHDTSSHIHIGDNFISDAQIPCGLGLDISTILNPLHNFKHSSLWQKYKNEINLSPSRSLLFGNIINNWLFNSPYTGITEDLEPYISDLYEIGHALFAPVLFSFCYNLVNNKEHDIYLFLSREGYILEQIYNIIESKTNPDLKEKRGKYFLSSRRTASFSTVETKEDIKNLLDYYFTGRLKDAVKARFDGAKRFSDKVSMRSIALPNELTTAYDELRPLIPEIIAQAENERYEYMNYVEKIICGSKNPAVIDLGYSGTIQKYLSRLTKRKVDGFYLILRNDAIDFPNDSNADGMYRQSDEIFEMDLFFESFLIAPYGQLLFFNNGMPVFKSDDNKMSKKVEPIQQGILDFTHTLSELIEKYEIDFKPGKQLLMKFVAEITNSSVISNELYDFFVVEDDYSNGNTIRAYDKYMSSTRKIRNLDKKIFQPSHLRFHADVCVRDGNHLCVLGWCTIEEYDAIDTNIYAEIYYSDQSRDTYMLRKIERRDVADFLSDPRVLWSGYCLDIWIEGLTYKDFTIRILAEHGGIYYELAAKLEPQFNVKEGE